MQWMKYQEFPNLNATERLKNNTAIVGLKNHQIIDIEGDSVVLASNATRSKLALYSAAKGTGKLPIHKGSGERIGICEADMKQQPGLFVKGDPDDAMPCMWFDVTQPTSVVHYDNEDVFYFFDWPENSKSDILVGPIGGKFAPIHRKFCTGKVGALVVEPGGNIVSCDAFKTPQRKMPQAWKRSDKEVMETPPPGIVVMEKETVDIIMANLVFEEDPILPIDDGSLMKIVDGRLWNSSYSNPSEFVWVPVVAFG
jgi:hypothetical protein